MEERFKLFQAEPDAFKAMRGIEDYVRNSGLDKKLYELIKIRASQINGWNRIAITSHTPID